MTVDLHSHTSLSDGSLGPRELIRAAREAGVTTLSVTDHDTTVAIPECLDEARVLGLRLVPGIEISSFVGVKNLHVLGFFAIERLAGIAEWQRERQRVRLERLDDILVKLSELGAPLTRDEVTGEGFDPRRNIGRPHIARALVARGFVKDQREAFDRFLGHGKPACVEYPRPDPRESCALVHRLGGLAFVAHPALDDLDSSLEELKESGVDGVEVFHPDHAPPVREHYLARARALELLVSGGSDHHGTSKTARGASKSEGGALGASPLPLDHWARLDEALARAATNS